MNSGKKHVFISEDLEENIKAVKNNFGNSFDLVINHFCLSGIDFACIYIHSLVDINIINSLSQEIFSFKQELGSSNKGKTKNIEEILFNLQGFRKSRIAFDYETLYDEILLGNTVILIEGSKRFLSVSSFSSDGRPVEEATSQTVIRGPKESFNENIYTNVLLIRKRLRSDLLRFEKKQVGRYTKTTIGIMYIEGIAKESFLQEIKSRLDSIQIDGVFEGGYIEELTKDDRYSVFPTYKSTERPDTVAASLLEGKIAVLVDGTPFVLTIPSVFFDFFQSSEDYYHHFVIASMIRVIRYVALILTMLVPSFYIAVTTFHQEILPTPLLISIAAQREGVPLPVFWETLLMEFVFEILREAGIRMPRAIGSAISIVGALVLGQAAVNAGFISAAIVIIVSITAISSFAIPSYEMANAIRAVRFALMPLAALLGLYGIIFGLMILLFHLCKIKSLTFPYLTPFSPRIRNNKGDAIFRYPLWSLRKRPAGISKSPQPKVKNNKKDSNTGERQELT